MKFIIAALLVLSTLTAAEETKKEEIRGVEYLLANDGQAWKIATTNQNADQEVRTYIVADQTPDNWVELFTVQAIQGLKMEPKKFFALLTDKLKSLAPASKLETKIISESDNELFGEWWIADKGENDQHEWVRLIQAPDAFVILRYTSKKDPMDAKQLEAWTAALKGAKTK